MPAEPLTPKQIDEIAMALGAADEEAARAASAHPESAFAAGAYATIREVVYQLAKLDPGLTKRVKSTRLEHVSRARGTR